MSSWPSYANAYAGPSSPAQFEDDATTWTTSSGNKQVSITPVVGELLVVVCGASGINAPTSVADNQGGTYTQAVLALRTTSGYVAIYVRTALVTSAVSHTLTLSQSGDTGGGLTVQRWSGLSFAGSAVVVQTGSVANQAASTVPTIPFASPVIATDPVIASVSMTGNPGTLTAPAGYTRQQAGVIEGYGSPPTSLESSTIDAGTTASGVTYGSVASQSYGAVAVELKTTLPRTIAFTAPNITFTANPITLSRGGRSIAFTAGVVTFSANPITLTRIASGGVGSKYGTAVYGTSKYGSTGTQNLFAIAFQSKTVTFAAQPITLAYNSLNAFQCKTINWTAQPITLTITRLNPNPPGGGQGAPPGSASESQHLQGGRSNPPVRRH